MAKYLDYVGLQEYDEKLKAYVNGVVANAPSKVDLPFDVWDGFGSLNSVEVPSPGWYVVQGVPGAGCLLKVEIGYDNTADRTLYKYLADGRPLVIHSSKNNATGGYKLHGNLLTNGAWTAGNYYIYYKKL